MDKHFSYFIVRRVFYTRIVMYFRYVGLGHVLNIATQGNWNSEIIAVIINFFNKTFFGFHFLTSNYSTTDNSSASQDISRSKSIPLTDDNSCFNFIEQKTGSQCGTGMQPSSSLHRRGMEPDRAPIPPTTDYNRPTDRTKSSTKTKRRPTVKAMHYLIC